MRKMMLVLLASAMLCVVGCKETVPEDGTGLEVNAKWFVARGAPSDGTGADGDLYLDTETTVLYVKVEGAWVNVAALQGASGTGWLIGTGAPSASLGGEGDLYLDTSSTAAYKKANGVWTYLFALQGAAGPTGATGEDGEDGANGATWFAGSGEPTASVPVDAVVGDLYLDTSSTIVYRKYASGWSVLVYFQAAITPQVVFTPYNIGYDMYGVAYGEVDGDGLIVAVGAGGYGCVSEDGTTWYLVEGGGGADRVAPARGESAARVTPRGLEDTGGFSRTTATLRDVVFGIVEGTDAFVAVGYPDDDTYSIRASIDGANWGRLGDGDEGWYLETITYVDGMFLACGGNGAGPGTAVIVRSTDGITWEEPTTMPEIGDEYLRGIAYGAGVFVAVGEYGTVLTSPDGDAWTGVELDVPFISPHLFSITYANATFVAVGYEDYDYPRPLILLSSDGSEWHSQDVPLDFFSYQYPGYSTLSGVASGTGGFVAVGTDLDYVYEYVGEGYDDVLVPHAVVLTSAAAVSWAVDRWDGYASAVCWTPLNGGMYVVARGDSRIVAY